MLQPRFERPTLLPTSTAVLLHCPLERTAQGYANTITSDNEASTVEDDHVHRLHLVRVQEHKCSWKEREHHLPRILEPKFDLGQIRSFLRNVVKKDHEGECADGPLSPYILFVPRTIPLSDR